MKTPHWIVIFGQLAAGAAAARTEAAPVDADARPVRDYAIDIVVASTARPTGRPDVGAGIGVQDKSELHARAQQAAREAIESLEISLGRWDERS